MKILKVFVIFTLILLLAIVSFQLGSRISEVKIAMIHNLDDIATVHQLKGSFESRGSMELYEVLKKKYVWRSEKLRKAYDASLFKPLMKFDKDVENGFIYFEDQLKKH